MRKAILLLVGMIPTGRADSIQRIDRVILLGRIVQMDSQWVTIAADYPDPRGTEEVKVPRDQVATIEFNASTYNPGAPGPPGALPGNASKSPLVRVAKSYAVLDDGAIQPCDDATIDVQHGLHCGKKVFSEDSVLRIYLAKR